jgi:hypothetical protein
VVKSDHAFFPKCARRALAIYIPAKSYQILAGIQIAGLILPFELLAGI